jgi:hypothetical protein
VLLPSIFSRSVISRPGAQFGHILWLCSTGWNFLSHLQHFFDRKRFPGRFLE